MNVRADISANWMVPTPTPGGNVLRCYNKNMSLSKKQIFGLIVFLVLLAAIPVSLYLVKQQQILKSKASSGQAPAMLKEDISLAGFNIYNPEIVDMGSGDFRYKMWFMGWPLEGQNDKIWLAVSSDLNTWCVYNGSASEKDYDCPSYDQASWKPVLSPSLQPNTWDGWHNGDPSVVWDPDTSYFYMAYTGLGTDVNSKEINQANAIGAARSQDGINWEKAGNNPIVAPNGSNTWDCQQVARPSLLKERSKWLVYYDGYSDDGKDYPSRCSSTNPFKGRSQVGLMFTDASWQGDSWQGWTRQPSSLGEGLVMPATQNQCFYIANVDVKKMENKYKMVYDTFGFGSTCDSNNPGFSRRIAEAQSSDGLTWVDDPSNPILQGESPWQRNEVPEYFFQGADTYIYFGETTQQGNFRLKIKRAKLIDSVPTPTSTPSSSIIPSSSPSLSPSPTPSVSPSPSPLPSPSSTWSPGPSPIISSSPSPSPSPSPAVSKKGDFNKDGKVNAVDVSILFSNWNKTNFLKGTDLNSDNKINSVDFATLKSLLGK